MTLAWKITIHLAQIITIETLKLGPDNNFSSKHEFPQLEPFPRLAWVETD